MLNVSLKFKMVLPEERVATFFTLLHLENDLVSIITKTMHLK